MPRANWLTPAGGNTYQEEPEPKGLLGFLGAGPDFGTDVGDRLGVISQILMNLGSGRGGAGIAEATAAVNARSAARRERRKAERMVARAADKIESSNPEVAAAMRANTEFGLQILGKQIMMPFEFEQESKLAQMRGDIDLDKALKLADRKRKAELEDQQNWRDLMGLGRTIAPAAPDQTSDAGGIPTEDLVVNDPTTASLGTGEGEIQISPLSSTSVVTPQVRPDQSAPEASQVPPEYTVGLPDNPALADSLLKARLHWGDPDMPMEDLMQLVKAGGSENHVGFDDFKQAVAARKETRRRATEFATRSNEVARQNQTLPGINLQQPGQLELMQAGIDPSTVPPQQQVQQAEYLKQAYKTGDKDYTAALKDLQPSESQGVTIYNDDGTVKAQIGGSGGGAPRVTEQMHKWIALHKRAMSTEGLLDDRDIINAYTSFWQQRRSEVPLVSGYLTTKEFKAGKLAAENFLTAILRQESMATITEHEEESYSSLFLPQPGDDDNTLAIRKRMREAALEGLKKGGQTELEAKAEAAKAFSEAKRTLEAELGPEAVKYAIPPYSEKARKAGITEEEWHNNSDPRAWAKFRD